jgi:hypothetical protein
MSSRLLALAEAVTTLLNDDTTTWSQVFEATRTAVPKYEAKTGALEVKVRPVGSTTIGHVGREKLDRDYTIDIVIAQKVSIADNTDTDPLIDFAEEIAVWFESDDGKPRIVQTSPRAWVTQVQSMPSAYAWEYAVEDQFVAVRRLTIKCVE